MTIFISAGMNYSDWVGPEANNSYLVRHPRSREDGTWGFKLAGMQLPNFRFRGKELARKWLTMPNI